MGTPPAVQPAEVFLRVRSAAGFAIVDLLFVCGIIGILSSIALPRLMTARGAATSASAIGSLRVIASGEVAFAITCGGGFYAPTLTKLAKPPLGASEGYLRSDLGAADQVIKSGYEFELATTPYGGAPDTCNGLGTGQTGLAFKVKGDPLDVPNNTRYFGTNAGIVIWEDTASLFASMPEAGDPPAGHPIKF